MSVSTYTLLPQNISYTANSVQFTSNANTQVLLNFTSILNTYGESIVEVTTYSLNNAGYFGRCLVIVRNTNIGVQSDAASAVGFSVSGTTLTIDFTGTGIKTIVCCFVLKTHVNL